MRFVKRALKPAVSILRVILVLIFIISAHELGHFTVAKIIDVKVNEFSVGFGPKIYSASYGETLYSIRAIPLGGYNDLEGQTEQSKDPRSFEKKGFWQKEALLFAGPLVNIIIAGGFLGALLIYLRRQRYPLSFQDIFSRRDRKFADICKTRGSLNYLHLVGEMSWAIGVFNLMPIPPLDGGRIAFILSEKALLVARLIDQPLSSEVQALANMVGIAIMLGYTVLKR